MGTIKFGVMTQYTENIEDNFIKAKDLNLDSFMLNISVTSERKDRLIAEAPKIKALSEQYGVEISAIWANWGAPVHWNLYDGMDTIGLIPIAYRDRRMQYMLNASEFAAAIGVKEIVTHAGFIPENPLDPVYTSFVAMMKYLAGAFKSRGQYFNFETGQETPFTLLRAITDIGTGNLGVNLDTANLIIYGKANPVDAMLLLGPYVRCTHLKDANWPTDGYAHGKQTKIGQGAVNLPEVIRLLHQYGYQGHFTIEREISGEQQIADIRESSVYIRELCSHYDWQTNKI